MTITIVNSKIKCRLWHRWELIFGNQKTHYFICEKCGSRKAEQQPGGYQPINMDFLSKAEDV